MRYNQVVCYEKQENWEEAKNAANEYIADYPRQGYRKRSRIFGDKIVYDDV